VSECRHSYIEFTASTSDNEDVETAGRGDTDRHECR
jgi:hypothetical protein